MTVILKAIDFNNPELNLENQPIEVKDVLDAYKDFYPKIDFLPPWIGYFIENALGEIVGSCGFVGKPQDGKVEIAYWTFEKNQGQGVASEACRLLVALAQKTDKSLMIVAKTAPEINASTKILTKNGFLYAQVVQDHEIGDAWLWVLAPKG